MLTYRKINRLRQIVVTALKYGFQDLVERLRLRNIAPLRGKVLSPSTLVRMRGKSFPERLRFLLEELGPTFIKLGQMLSLRSDLIPIRITEELRKLQDQIKPFPRDEVDRIVLKELKYETTQLFSEFNYTPIAAASVAQVHEALTVSGDRVAVKILRPGIRKIVDADIAILEDLVSLAERYDPSLGAYNLPKLLEYFSKAMQQELDCMHEARNIELFRDKFDSDPNIQIPRVFWEYTSRQIVTMEFVDGIPLSHKAAIDALPKARKKSIAKSYAESSLKQIFRLGIFHGDPHHGNLMVLTEQRIAFLDFGLIGFIHDDLQNLFQGWLKAFVRKDVNRIVRDMVFHSWLPDEVDEVSLTNDIWGIASYYYDIPLSKISISRILTEFDELIRRNRISLPVDFALLIRAIITIEGVTRDLDPEFNFFNEILPYVKEFSYSRLDPVKNSKYVFEFLRDSGLLIKDLPMELGLILKKIRAGKIKAQLEHRGLDNLNYQINRSVNHLSFSIVIAGLLVGSSLVLQLDIQPKVFGISLIGFVGYALAGILGIGLLIAIIFRRKF
jgi:ubiquinone biosynthesis protein